MTPANWMNALSSDDLVLRLAEEVDADRRLGVALADRGAGVEVAGAARHLEADERTQRAIGSLRAGVEVQPTDRAEARGRLRVRPAEATLYSKRAEPEIRKHVSVPGM